jgi:hypothetical protein
MQQLLALRIPVLAVWLAGCAAAVSSFAAEEDVVEWSAEELAFFETRIRPVLVEHCYRCHSGEAAEKKLLRGGLRLDSRAGLLHGGDSGPALVPGKPAESLLLESLRYESFEMPPDGKLPDKVIADFAQWVERGAADPRTGEATAAKSTIDLEAGRRHWAYQPLAVPPSPPQGAADGPAAIDQYIVQKLDAAGLTPQPLADRRTLARRLTFDLTGLPPTPQEIAEFVADERPDANERYVDHLLASPQFGVRWGRHWLDLARFAESVTLRGLVQHEAWRYRDYVVDAFNHDLPFDRFLREQIAGDLLPGETIEERQRQSIGTTFLTLTDANLEEQDKQQLRMDVVDEQLIVIGEGLLGQTIGCARCHDHKFDPIPTADYYALAGILHNTRVMEHSNVSRWLDRPLPLPPEQEQLVAAAEAEATELRDRIAKLKRAIDGKPDARKSVASRTLPGIVIDDEQAVFAGDWMHSVSVKPFVEAGYRHDQNGGCGEKSATFESEVPSDGMYEVRFGYTPGTNRSTYVAVTIETADGDREVTVNQRESPAIDGLFVTLGRHRFTTNAPARVIVSNQRATGVVVVDAVQFIPESAATDVKPTAPVEDADVQPPSAERQQRAAQLKELESKLKALERSAPRRPLYQGVEEEAEITDLPQQIRGNLHNPGPRVPRGFLQVVRMEATPDMPADQSGRRQLGDWLAEPSNPLPARVYVNRVWHWLFGAGIVSTPDNFGTTGEAPSHPELLDYLAGRFTAQGWSTKQLIREIVLSEAYRRQSTSHAASAAIDPENRLLWRMHRKSLEAECLQDAVLATTGELDLALGGHTIPDGLSADYDFAHDSRRRALYWPQLRNSRPRLLTVFDGANPSLVTGKRAVSQVAPQGLYLMNDPWVMDQAERTARRLLERADPSDTARVEHAFQLILGREATDAERSAITQFLTAGGNTDPKVAFRRWSQVVQSLYASLDFRFLN